MSTPVTLRLPYPVSANRYWRHAIVCNRAQTYLSKEAKEYKAEVAILAKAAGLTIPLDGRVAWRIQLFPKQPLDFAKRAARNPDFWDDDVMCMDLGNCEKVLADALNGIAWVDDKQIRRTVLERFEPVGEAHVLVTIGRLHQVAVAPDLFAAVA
jgi:crossover junction endodeoxyribonuclease RusA